MTSRATFGDLAIAASRHLEAPASDARAAGLPASRAAVAEAQEYLAVLPRMLKIIARYAADIAAAARRPGQDPASPWPRAAAEVHRAAQNAYQHLPPAAFITGVWPRQKLTSTPSRNLDAALTEITAARDLLQTHFETTADGTARDRSEWGPVITSPSVQKALLNELAGWSRHIVSHGARVATPTGRHAAATTQGQRRVLGICQRLMTLVTVVETAHAQEPVTDDDRRQLHRIPVNMPSPHAVPARSATVNELSVGIAECAERVRSAAAASADDGAWSPQISAESFAEAAMYASVISHHCEILQQSLAARAAQLGAIRLRNDLLACATAAGRTRQSWLKVVRTWNHIKTDAIAEPGPVAGEAASLALWTGRLAYADPDWNLTAGPADDHRPALELAPDTDTFTRTLAAVHQAVSSLTTIAVADYTKARTAALTGRLLVPIAQVPQYARNTDLYTRAPDRRANELLYAYRDAGTASVKTTATIEAVTAEHQAAGGRPAQRPGGPLRGGRAVGRVVPATAIATSEPDPPAGPIERILADLGVTDPEVLKRGMALDQAASQLVAEAADQTASQRWHTAVINRPGAITNSAAITRHVLLADRATPIASRHSSRDARAFHGPKAQAEPLQAEP